MLDVDRVDVFYGDLQALWDVSLKADKGQMVVLVGSNGAGKTTLLRTICGLSRPRAGSISFFDQRIDVLPPHEIVERGISLVPEGRLLFPYMTVFENLLVGAHTREAWKRTDESLEWVYEIFHFLRERRTQLASTLSGGEQQMLAIARGLMSRPKLLMLDEPSQGLAPMVVNRIFEVVKEINQQGVTILLVEQNVRLALRLAHFAYVLETGRITLEGSGDDLLGKDEVKRAYLGR